MHDLIVVKHAVADFMCPSEPPNMQWILKGYGDFVGWAIENSRRPILLVPAAEARRA